MNTDFSGVIAFTTEHDLQSLLDDINTAFPEAHLCITDEHRDCGLVVDFEDLFQHLRPRCLGRSTSRLRYDSWIQQLQTETAMVLPDNGDRSVEAFKAKISAAAEINKYVTLLTTTADLDVLTHLHQSQEQGLQSKETPAESVPSAGHGEGGLPCSAIPGPDPEE